MNEVLAVRRRIGDPVLEAHRIHMKIQKEKLGM
jgi:hypothetical protein